MRTAKNMDSVFSNYTDDELMFDIAFDDDDLIIDAIEGVDECGNYATDRYISESDAEDEENQAQDDSEIPADAPCKNECTDMEAREGKCDNEGKPEGTDGCDLEIGGEVGDGKEVSGKENSAESNAYDTKDEEEAIGMNDKQQVKLEDAAEGPLEDDDQAEREGEVDDLAIETESALLALLEADDEEVETPDDAKADDNESEPAEAPADEKCNEAADDEKAEESDDKEEESSDDNKEEAATESTLLGLLEADDEPVCPNDGDVRAGVNTLDTKNVEGVKTSLVGAAADGDAKEYPIEDYCDDCEREGKVKHDTSNVEGESQEALGAELESSLCDDDDMQVDYLLSLLDKDIEELIPDTIKVNEAAADEDEIIDDIDDDDIKAIDDEKNDDSEGTDVNYDYDDDELIDAVINNLD